MFQESLLMYQVSLRSCQAWQATANPTFKFGNAPRESGASGTTPCDLEKSKRLSVRGITHNLIDVRARHAILGGMNAMTRSKRCLAGLTRHQEEVISGVIGSCCRLIRLSLESS
jgi:hypothetical protein